jgi:hypothetical protein
MFRTMMALVALALPFAATAAPGTKAEPRAAKPGSPGEVIRAALDATDNFDFTGVTLAAVLQTIGDQFKITIVLDRSTLNQMGFEPEGMNVELKMKSGKLRDALRAIVGQYNLTFVPIGDSLHITTEEQAIYKQLKQRVNVNLDAVPVGKAVKELAAKHGVNVVIDPRVVKSKAAENPVTLQVDDVPFEAAVRLLSELGDLAPVRMGNVLLVTTEARAEKLKNTEKLVPVPVPAVPMIPGLDGVGVGAVPAVPPMVIVPARPEKADPPAKEKE